jgi:hypothetical protein
MGAYQGRRHCVYVKKGEGRGEWSMRKVVSSCAWRWSWKGYEKMKYGMDLCVTSNHIEASGL